MEIRGRDQCKMTSAEAAQYLATENKAEGRLSRVYGLPYDHPVDNVWWIVK